MKPDCKGPKMDVGDELSTFGQLTATGRELGFHEQQALGANTQEIVDLYSMLRHKGRQEGPLDAADDTSNPTR